MSEERKTDTTPESPTGVALREFARKANVLLSEVAAASSSLEKRVVERAETRAAEQSAVMSKTEEETAALRRRFDEERRRVDALTKSVSETDKACRDIKRRIGEAGEEVKRVLAACAEIDAKAGDRFGNRLEALGTQVASLTKIGERMAAVEGQSKRALDNVASSREASVVSGDDLRGRIDGICKRLAALEPKPDPKPEKPKTAGSAT